MKRTKKNRSRVLAGTRRNPSRDSEKDLGTIIPKKHRRRYRIRMKWTEANYALVLILLTLGVYFGYYGMHCLMGY